MLVGDGSSVWNASCFAVCEPGDGSFHGRPQVPVGLLGFVLAHRVLFLSAPVVVLVDFDGPSTLRGGASCPQGAAPAPLREGGGVTGGTGHCPSFGIDIEVVAVEPVFDVRLAYDWFHHRGVTKIVERCKRGSGRVHGIGDDFGSRGWSATRSAMLSVSDPSLAGWRGLVIGRGR